MTMAMTVAPSSEIGAIEELMWQQANSSDPLNVTETIMTMLDEYHEALMNERNFILVGLYVPVVLLALTANILVIAVVFKFQFMRSVTNYFVVNLSLADLLVTTICMPMQMIQSATIQWIFGEIMCKVSYYIQGVAVAASVFTITAMSIDRYLAIRSPIAFRRIFNRKSTIFVIAFLWAVALVIFMPLLFAVTLQDPDEQVMQLLRHSGVNLTNQTVPDFYICSEDFGPLAVDSHVFGIVIFFVIYAVPGFIVIIAYSMMGRTLCARKPPFDCDSIRGSASSQQGSRLVKERRRVAWILLLLAVLFALCWLPFHVLRLLVDFSVITEDSTWSRVLSYCLLLGHVNSALNPIVYCFMTRNFRRSVLEILRLDGRGPHQTLASGTVGYWRRSHYGGPLMPNQSANHLRHIQAANALRRTGTTSSTTHDSSFYHRHRSRHNPHRRCYMLRSLPQPGTERKEGPSPIMETETEECNPLKSSQLEKNNNNTNTSTTREPRKSSGASSQENAREHDDRKESTSFLVDEK